jgi:hypothetical protein
MLSKAGIVLAMAGSAAAFGVAPIPSLRAQTGVSSISMMAKYPKEAPSGAPPADLFNIWRNDYMLDPSAAAREAEERTKDTIFDGVLPPFSQGFNQVKGSNLAAPTIDRGEGPTALFSTVNVPSAYEPRPTDYIPRKGILPSTVSGLTPEQVLANKGKLPGQTPKAAPKAARPVGTTPAMPKFKNPFAK